MDTNGMLHELSRFYLALWRRLDLFSDESRWLTGYSGYSPEDERKSLEIEALRKKKGELPLADDVMRRQVNSDFEVVEQLVKEFQSANPEVKQDWLSRVNRYKQRFGDIGLHYAELIK